MTKKKKIQIISFDCKNIKKLKKIIVDEKIDTLIHCAADIDVSKGEKNKKKYLENNYILTKKIVTMINQTECKYFLFSSTAAVYGKINGKVRELSEKKPINIYGKSKLKSENFIKKKLSKNKKYLIFRYFNVVGCFSGKIGVINKNVNPLFKVISKNILSQKNSIKIFGKNFDTKDGTAIRDYVHIEDLCDFHFQLYQKLKKDNRSDIFNLGYGKGYSNLDIINGFKCFIKKNVNVKFIERRKNEVPISICNNIKLKNNINYRPKKNNLKKMIVDSFTWFKRNI